MQNKQTKEERGVNAASKERYQKRGGLHDQKGYRGQYEGHRNPRLVENVEKEKQSFD